MICLSLPQMFAKTVIVGILVKNIHATIKGFRENGTSTVKPLKQEELHQEVCNILNVSRKEWTVRT